MNLHANARTTPRTRLLLVQRVLNEDWSVTDAASAMGISRATANRRWQYGIAVIVWRLNGKQVPQKRSIDFVVKGAARYTAS